MPARDVERKGVGVKGFCCSYPAEDASIMKLIWKFFSALLDKYSVNSAFQVLRLLIPTEPKDRRLSKIETLRLAKSYINHLATTLTTGTRKKLLKWSRLLNFIELFLTGNCQVDADPNCYHSMDEINADHGRIQRGDRRSNICTFCISSRN